MDDDLKNKTQSTAYLFLQIILLLILCILPNNLIISSSVVMFLLGGILLVHSNQLINKSNWSKISTYNFVIIVITIFFIPAYAMFRSIFMLIVGITTIIANIIALMLSFPLKLSFSLSIPKQELKSKLNTIRDKTSIKLSSKKKSKKNIVAVVGGSKFHSLDCKMIENKSKKRLKYYSSAQDAKKDGLKPCKLCKAVNYLHQL